MANFLITTPNSLTQGTDTQDLFDLRAGAGDGVSIVAAGGADTISAAATGFAYANIQAGAGNDTVTFSVDSGTLTNAAILLGEGDDVLTVATGAQAGTSSAGGGVDITGGGGNDSITMLSGANFAGGSSVNGNQGADTITIFSAGTFTNALIAGGGGADVVNAQGIVFSSTTVNGGGGNDSLTLSGTFTGSRIEGDTLGDSEFIGNDTITIGGTFGSSLVQGGQGNDNLIISGGFGTGASVEGGTGTDSIFINAFVASGGTYVGGGAGIDTITVSAVLVANFGTVQGGGGNDVITVSAGAANGGFIFGGAGADAISLGILASGAAVSGGDAPVGASSVNVGYAAFSESTLGSFDQVNVADVTGATGTGSFGSFMVSQDVTNFSVVAFDGNGVSGTSVGKAVFSGSVSQSLTARAVLLDATLASGNAVLFQDASLTYLFVQGGAAGSGTAGDLVVQLAGVAENAYAASGSIARVSNSLLKVNFVA